MNKDMLVPLLEILAVILVAVAITQPWWSVRTTPELQLLSPSGSSITVDENLFKTLNVVRTNPNGTDALAITIVNATEYRNPVLVNAYPFSYMFQDITAERIDGTETSFTFNLGNMTSFETQTKQIIRMTDQTLLLLLAGLVLATVTTLLTIAVTRMNMAVEIWAILAGALAAIILLIGPLMLYSNVNSFSGSLQVTIRNSVWRGDPIVTWGPSIGWYLPIAAALLILVCLYPINMIRADRKRGIQSLK